MVNPIKAISVHDATVKTAVVEIKTLTISGKQVTLAVFRQLPEENLIDPKTGQLNGIAWGRVNYHPDKCADDGIPHMHVVWQKGDQLRRSYIPARRPYYGSEQQTIDDFQQAASAAVLCQFWRMLHEAKVQYRKPPEFTIASDHVIVPFPSLQKNVRVRLERYGWRYRDNIDHHTVYLNYWGYQRDGEEFKLQVPDQIDTIFSLVSWHDRAPKDILDFQEQDWYGLWQQCRQEASELDQESNRLRQAWKDQYATLQALDQLFIAV